MVNHFVDSTLHNLLPWCNLFILLNEKPLMYAESDAQNKPNGEPCPET
jgi:hypothetical protein